VTASAGLTCGEPAQIADSVREIGKWVESLIDRQINPICALLGTASLRDALGGHVGADR